MEMTTTSVRVVSSLIPLSHSYSNYLNGDNFYYYESGTTINCIISYPSCRYFKCREICINLLSSADGPSILITLQTSFDAIRIQCFTFGCRREMSDILFAVPLDPIDGSSKTISVPIVQELAVKQPHELPARYIASQEERPSLVMYSPDYGIPVINMARLLNSVSDEGRQTEMKKLAMACEEWGFFQVVNHGIPGSLMERMLRITREFFQLPLEERKEYAIVPSTAFEGYGQLFVASEDQRLDWADMLFLRTLPPEDRKMRVWPTKPVEFREIVSEYATETQKLGDKLLSLLAENLCLRSHDYFVRKCGGWSQSIRMNYYPPCPRPDLALGLSPHSDGSGITILLQDGRTEGLHIRKDGEWIGVQIIQDALVINIGDMLEVMTNGRYKSVEHRAVTNKEKDRISLATFYTPGRQETEIGPAPDLIDELHPCLYKRFKTVEYGRHYLGNRLDGKKALEYVKIRPPQESMS